MRGNLGVVLYVLAAMASAMALLVGAASSHVHSAEMPRCEAFAAEALHALFPGVSPDIRFDTFCSSAKALKDAGKNGHVKTCRITSEDSATKKPSSFSIVLTDTCDNAVVVYRDDPTSAR